MKTFKELFEKKLTPAELKKREEIAKAMERENPGMDMGKKMAIATAAAKRVAEEAELDEAKGALTYTPKATKYAVIPDSKKEFVKHFNTKAEAEAHSGKHGGKVRPVDQYGRSMRIEEVELEEAEKKTPEQKLQDIRDAIGLAREARRMKGQRIQSKREIDLQRKHDELSQKMREQKNEEVELEENSSIYMSKIEGGSGKGKGFGDKGTTVDDHLSAMKHHSSEYQKAMKDKRDADARHHGMKYHKHKDQIERLGDVGNYRKEDVDEAYMSSDRSKQMFKRKELDQELRHEVEPKRSEPAEPHAVHINGKKWKTFSTKSHATNVAKKIAGATVVKESLDEATDYHDQAQEHKKKSDKAMDKNDMEAYHHHMSNYHEALGQWEESKGRSSNAQKHYDKAEGHHELSLKKNEGTDMLSFKYFQEMLEEAKKKCKESSSEIELAHGEMLDKEEDDEEDEAEIKEASYSAKAAAAGKDIGKPGKMFDVIAKKAGEKYGSEERGKKVAGAVLKKLRAKNEEVEIDEQAPVAPVPGMKDKNYAIMVHPESKQRVTIERKNVKNYPASEGWKEVAPGMKEEVELDELSKNTVTSYALKAGKKLGGNIAALGAAKDISKFSANPTSPDEIKKRLNKSITNRTAGLAAASQRLSKEEVEEAVSPFDWKAYAKEKGTASSGKTKTFHDVKKTSTGTVYTKQVNPDGTSKGSGEDAAKAAEVEQAPKRGRGRPPGVGAKTGSYKPRDPAKKAASAAKAAASKAANRAARNEEFDNEFMGSLIEGFEDEDFDDFLYCEEFEELDEATRAALINFINEKYDSKMKESLTGNQVKLDKNKNGKLDSQDFKLLRKEETEQVQESVNKYAAFLTKKQ